MYGLNKSNRTEMAAWRSQSGVTTGEGVKPNAERVTVFGPLTFMAIADAPFASTSGFRGAALWRPSLPPEQKERLAS
jgi:hypothetical protein